MLRKNSIVKYVFLAIIAVLGILLCVCPFNVPASSDRFNGFVDSIEKGIELEGGVSAIYTCSLPAGKKGDVAELIDNNIGKIKATLDKEGFTEFALVRQGNNKMRLEVAGVEETSSLFSYIENAKTLNVTLEKDNEDAKVYMTGENISSAYANYDYSAQTYGVQIEFSAQGKEELDSLKSTASEISATTAYFYLGKPSSENLFAEVAVSKLDKSMFVTASSSATSYSTSSYSECKKISYTIIAGASGLEISLDEACNITPVMGENTLLLIAIASIVTIVLVFAFMWIRYGDLGLMGILSLVYFLVLDMFLIQSIPFIVLNLAGVIGIFAGFILAVVSQALVFEKIREEYAIGKKIHLACKGGFKKVLWPVLDIHFMLALAGLTMWIVAPGYLKCFAVILFIGVILSLFCSLALTRYFVKIYLPINASNAKRMHLYRDASVVEIKEEEPSMTTENQAEIVIGGQENE